MSPSVPDQRSEPEQRRFLLAAGIVVALALWLFSSHLSAPFDRSFHGWNGAFYSQVGRNFVRQGPMRLGFAMNCAASPIDAPEPYLRHPPMVGLLVALSFTMFGEGEWQARLVPLVLSCLACFLLLCFLRRSFDSIWFGAGATVTAFSLPVWSYYASMVDPQGSGVIFAIAGALWATQRFAQLRRDRDLWLANGFLVFGMSFDWPAYIAAGILGVWSLLALGRDGRKTAVVYWGVATVSGVATIAWTYGVASHFGAESGVFEAFLRRAAMSSEVVDDQGTPLAAGAIVSRILELHASGFFLPVSISGFVAAIWIGIESIRKRIDAAHGLLLVPLGVGFPYVFVFPQGAYVHEYWQIYLAPGLALPLFGLLRLLSCRSARAGHFAFGLAAIVTVASWIAGYVDTRGRWSAQEAELSADKVVGQWIGASTAPNEVILSSAAPSTVLIYYSDRMFVWSVLGPESAPEQLAGHARLTGGLLVRAGERSPLIDFLDRTPQATRKELGSFVFWDVKR